MDEPQGSSLVYPIPGGLVDEDYVEINGICVGNSITAELLTQNTDPSLDDQVIPLQVVLMAGGPVIVRSRLRDKVSEQEHFTKRGIQRNLTYELIIVAYDDKFEVYLNKEKICEQPHLVPISDISLLAMNGEADVQAGELRELLSENPANLSDGEQKLRTMLLNKTLPVNVSLESSYRMKKRTVENFSPQSARNAVRSFSPDKQYMNMQTEVGKNYRYPALDVDVAPKQSPLNVRTSNNAIMEQQVYQRPSIDIDTPMQPKKPSFDDSPNMSFGYPTPKTSQPKLMARNTEMEFGSSVAELNGPQARANLHQSQPDLSTSAVNGQNYYQNMAVSTPVLNVDPVKKKRFSLTSSKNKREKVVSMESTTTEKSKKKFNPFNIFKKKDKTSRTSIDTGIPSTRVSVSTPQTAGDKLPKAIRTKPPPELSSYIHTEVTHYPNQVDDITLTGGVQAVNGPTEVYRYEEIEQRVAPGSRASIPSKPPQKLKGEAPVIADQLEANGLTDGMRVDTTLTGGQELAYIPATPVEAVHTIPDQLAPQKLKGKAPELAAMIHPDSHTAYLEETTLTGLTMLRPAIDSDPMIKPSERPPEQAIVRPVSPQRPQSFPNIQQNFYESDASSVYTDGEFYLDVGKSAYFLERRQSLKHYPSYRSHKKARAMRRTMKERQSSRASSNSSISSLKVGEKTLRVQTGRERYRPKPGDVAVWLEQLEKEQKMRPISHASNQNLRNSQPYDYEYGSEPEEFMKPTYAGQSTVFAAPPPALDANLEETSPILKKPVDAVAVAKQPPKVNPLANFKLYVDYNDQVCDDEAAVNFPVPLTCGRSALLKGRFLNPRTMEPVIICFEPEAMTGSRPGIRLQLWPSGSVRVTEIGLPEKAAPLAEWRNENLIDDILYMDPEPERPFEILLVAKQDGLEVKVNQLTTLNIPAQIDAASFAKMKVDEEGASVALDSMLFPSELQMPLRLKVPDYDPNKNRKLHLRTKLTADTKLLSIDFKDSVQSTLEVLLDFVKSQATLSLMNNGTKKTHEEEIPYVPEQVRLLDVILDSSSDEKVEVCLNGKVFVSQTAHGLLSALAEANIEGDFKLMQAVLQ